MAFSGQRLVAARVAAGLTQQQLADTVGVARPLVSDWERGTTRPRASNVPAVAAAIGIDPLELVADDYHQLDLEALRLAAGLSRQALAEAAGMTFPRYQRLEAGERASDPPADLVRRLARILSVPVDTVLMARENARERWLRSRDSDGSARQ